jgi:deoxyadenosine/deoxycytidine kinase
VISDRVCFAKNCHASGVMTDMEYNIYCDFHSFITQSNSGLDIDAIVYLQAEPDVCMSRLKSRNRSEEEGVPLEYLKSLHACHEDWLVHRTVECPGFTDDIPVLTLDCNVDFKKNAGHLDLLLEQTRTFVDSVKRRS